MSCRYNDFEGTCTLWEDDVEMPGCNTAGICTCDDDEDPSVMCESYENAECDTCNVGCDCE